MTKRKDMNWSAFFGTLVFLGTLAVVVVLLSVHGTESTTAAPGRPIPPASLAAIAQKTEQLHVAHAKTAEEEDEAVPPDANAQASVSPEKATDIVQKSGLLGSGQVSSVNLTTTASGSQVYEVRTTGSKTAIILVDAQTGAVATPTVSVR